MSSSDKRRATAGADFAETDPANARHGFTRTRPGAAGPAFPPPPPREPSPPVPAFPPPPAAPVTPATRAFAVPDESTLRFGERVLRDDRAGVAPAARFDVDLRRRAQPPDEVLAEARAVAEAAGYAAGWAQGRREARAAAEAQADRDALAVEEVMAALTEQVERTMAAMAAAATTLERQAVPAIREIEDAIVNTALQIAEAVIGRELRTATEPGREAMTRALALAPAQRPVTVRLNPADRMSIGTTELVVDGRTVTLVDDASLRPGDAVAVCDATTIDARLGPAVERVREVLEVS
jgi:flagellar assembly protein FliH